MKSTRVDTEMGKIKEQLRDMKEIVQGRTKTIAVECDKKMNDTKKILNESLCDLRQQISKETDSEEIWRDVVSKQIDQKFMVTAADLNTVQKKAEETR